MRQSCLLWECFSLFVTIMTVSGFFFTIIEDARRNYCDLITSPRGKNAHRLSSINEEFKRSVTSIITKEGHRAALVMMRENLTRWNLQQFVESDRFNLKLNQILLANFWFSCCWSLSYDWWFDEVMARVLWTKLIKKLN